MVKRYKSKRIEPLVRTEPLTRKFERIPPEALLQARRKRQLENRKTPQQIFAPYQPPPGIVGESKKHPQFAMDEDSGWSGAVNWAINSAAQSAYLEGLAFLGYPILAEMSQRPEYRRFATVIATECTRKWIKLKSTGEDEDDEDTKKRGDKIRKINAELDRLRVRDRWRESLEGDLLMGRGHLYLDTGDTDDADELELTIGDGTDDVSKAKVGQKKKLEAIRYVEAVWTYPNDYNTSDPLKATWYTPERWWVMGKLVHSTRLLTIIGHPVPDLLKPAYSFGGLAMTQMTKPYVDNWLDTRQAVTDILKAFTTWVLATDLNVLMQNGGQFLFDRLSLFTDCGNNRGVLAINKEQEDFTNVSAPLGGLDALQAQAQEHLCSIPGIPVVKYMGIQPAGLNASSEGELRAWEDWVGAYQERNGRIPLTRIIGFIQLGLFGEIDENITFDFVPLHTLTELEEAQVQKTKADTGAELIEAGVIDKVEERRRLANDEESDYHGLEVEDVPEPSPEEMAQLGKAAQGFGRGEEQTAQAGGENRGGPRGKSNVAKIKTKQKPTKVEATPKKAAA